MSGCQMSSKFITFRDLGAFGRLGNQLYQCAAVVALAHKNKIDVKLPNFESVWHGQKCLMGEFCLSCDHLSADDIIHHNLQESVSSGNYDEKLVDAVVSASGNVNLEGYFQNMKYLSGSEEVVRKNLQPKNEHIENAKSFIDSLNGGKKQVVGIHVRRGDNTDGTNGSYYDNLYGDDLMDPNTIYGLYIKDALNIFSSDDYDFLVFTGGSRNNDNESDIEWVKKVFPQDNFYFSETSDTMTDFSRLMCCDHNILSHASSFGWWAAFLNQNQNKKVVAPKLYTTRNEPPKNFFPEEWTIL